MPDARPAKTPTGDPPSATESDTAAAIASDEAPAPEPWTAAKVLEWNAYYDLYLVLAVLLLGLLGSINLLSSSSVWTHLRAGQQLSERFDPTADTLSYTQEGHRWVHLTWLSDLLHYQVYDLVASFARSEAPPAPAAAPGAPAPSPAPSPAGEQWGIGGITVLDALVRVVTLLVLLGVRRKGPGLWWVAICAALALAVIPIPIIATDRLFGRILLAVGGLGGPVVPDGGDWGILFLCIELLLLFRALDQGRLGYLYGLVPLFLLWANFHESFFYGLALLAAAVIGMAVRDRTQKEEPAATGGRPARTARTGAIVLGVCSLVCLANPSFFKIYPAVIGSFVGLPGWSPGPITDMDTSLFAPLFQGKPSADDGSMILFGLLAGAGYLTFFLNSRRFSLPRLLVYSAAVLFWALMRRYVQEFAPVFASVVALNGQEWYQERFGTEGHMGRGWALWSTGGRAVTLAALGMVLVFRVVLGWWDVPNASQQFGLGFREGQFAFEVSDLLRDAPIKGNVFNMWLKEGDAMNWRAFPNRKVFIDSRRHLYSADVVAKYVAIREGLKDDAVDLWKPPLDEYGISAVLIDANISSKTYEALGRSRNWIRFYDDGSHVLFGRSDAKAEDLAYFRKHEMNVENLAYKSPEPAPSTERLPRSTSALDDVYKARARLNPHTLAAMRWLRPSDAPQGTPYIADPGRCILAIREARRALYANPNESAAYVVLADAYSTLLNTESALIGGIEPTAANVNAISHATPLPGLLSNRYRQLVTALKYAALTTPPPQNVDERRELANIHLRLFQVYMAQDVYDLAARSLDEWLKYAVAEDYPAQQYTEMARQLRALVTHVDEVQKAVTALGIETQANQIQKAMLARQRGAKGLAISLLEDGLQTGINAAAIKPTLIDLFCDVGEPDKAGELWTPGNTADMMLADGPTMPFTAAIRQGRVYLLLGNYESAMTVWTREAIPVLRGLRSLAAPMGLRGLLGGRPGDDTSALLEIPDEVGRQAILEYDVGMTSLEAGQPVDQTAAHLTNALKLAPKLAMRPVVAYYLKRLGRPVPELPTDAKPEAATAAAAGSPK